jgi:hypothetical protein
MRPIWEKLGTDPKMGLRYCAPEDWLPAEDYFGDVKSRHDQIILKNRLFDSHRSDVFRSTDSIVPVGNEVFEMVADHCERVLNMPRQAVPVGMDPFEAAARCVPEDLALISPVCGADGQVTDWALTAGAIAFPAHWVLQDKIGKSMDMVHGPVPNYRRTLEKPVNRFFSNMKTGLISCRYNWSLQFGDDLHAPHRSQRDPADETTHIEEIFVRIERQTLRKLPKGEHILFTIRTSLQSLGAWVGVDGALTSLATILETMPQPARDYKGAGLYETAIRRAAGAVAR